MSNIRDQPSTSSLQDLIKERRRNCVQAEESNQPIFDIYEKATAALTLQKLKTGITYDPIFTQHYCPWDGLHPEGPDRYTDTMKRLEELDLVSRCERILGRPATVKEITLRHDIEQANLLESLKHVYNDELENIASLYDSVYFNTATFDCALFAVGSAIELVKNIADGNIQNGLAVIRPPGHHASYEQFNGYCYFNNVAIAADYALNNCKVERILIVDWDVHHGQGTQRLFYNDPRVLYISIHRYEFGTYWPNLQESNFDCIGEGPGLGYNINVPLNETGCTDADYLRIFINLLLPIAYEFQPELVLVSAGYDAAIGCPEGEMKVTPGCYHHLTTLLMGLACGKIAVILEGGYFLPSLSEAIAQTLKALLGDPAPMLELSAAPKQSVKKSILDVMSRLRDYWHCINYFHDTHIGEPHRCHNHKVEATYSGIEFEPPFPTRFGYSMNSIADSLNHKNEILRLRKTFYANRRTSVGYIYDSAMELHKNRGRTQLESPVRIIRIKEILGHYSLLDRMIPIKGRKATVEELLMVHTLPYTEKIADIGTFTDQELNSTEGWTNVFTNAFTSNCALRAAGALTELVDQVIKGKVTSGVAIIRPPGHHAEDNKPGGFCIYNNVAIAALHARSKGLKRILIVDWDIHHGNGIQHCFYRSKEVLYISIHRFDDHNFYPHSVDADMHQVGVGSGLGHNVNIAWNHDNMGDEEYMAAFFRIVLPVAYEYNPELVIVAAGFDAAVGDPLGGYQVTPQAFGHFVQLLKPLAAGKIVLALEGGYNVNSVAYSMAMCCHSLLNGPLPMLQSCSILQRNADLALTTGVATHASNWKWIMEDIMLIDEIRQLDISWHPNSSSSTDSLPLLEESVVEEPDEPELELPNTVHEADVDQANEPNVDSAPQAEEQ